MLLQLMTLSAARASINNNEQTTSCWGGMVEADELADTGQTALRRLLRNEAAGESLSERASDIAKETRCETQHKGEKTRTAMGQ